MTAPNRLRVYLAGPDVFFPNALRIGEEKKRICAEHGFDGIFPLDAKLEFDGLEPAAQGYRCVDAMIELMDACDLIIANLTPFRGPSMDVGTAIEMGYMHGRNKPVFGYTTVLEDYANRVEPDGFLVESFGLADNLMVEGPIYRTGARVIRAQARSDEILTAMEGFTACVRHAAEVLARRSS
jgi:nucleoside 2-deoxyribosyltransferase